MSEYTNYLHFLIKQKYDKELKKLGEKSFKIIYEDEEIGSFNKNYIIILKKEEYLKSFYRIYSIVNNLNQFFKVVDVDFLKIQDRDSYTKEFIPVIMIVSKKNWEKEEYSDALDNRYKSFEDFMKKMDNILEKDVNFSYRLNRNMPNDGDLRNVFIKLVDKYFNGQNSLYRFSKKPSKQIADMIREKKDYNEKYSLINGRAKKEEILSKDLLKKKGELDKNWHKPICIIDLSDNNKTGELISNIKSLDLNIIVTGSQNTKGVISVDTFKDAEVLCSGYKYFVIADKKENKDYIMYDNTKNVIAKIEKKLNGNIFDLAYKANISKIDTVNVLAKTFLNFDGTNYYSGGAERYLIDLHKICQNIGLNLRIYQYANYDYVRFYENIVVVGVSDHNRNLTDEASAVILNRFNSAVSGSSKLNIYSSFMECFGEPASPSIGISHGVAWDHYDNSFKLGNKDKFYDEKSWILESAQNCDKIVSVDTNTANWFQTFDYKLGNTTEVIPNYVDIEEFSNKNNKDKKDDKIVLVYPRRLYRPRGMYVLLDVADDLLAKYPNLEIHFVGKGFEEDTKNIDNKIKKWKNRIKRYSCTPNDMHKVYKQATISVIPTLYSEGTSLSCLEAMASGNAVISTRVGGLSDLIINNYNGKLIEPNSKSLYDAVVELIENPRLMKKCRKNAVEVAKAFNKKTWNKRWEGVIKDFVDTTKCKYKEYNLAKIYIDDAKINKSKDLIDKVNELLADNYIVYVLSPNGKYAKDSWGRLQFLNYKDELYKDGDLVIKDKEFKGKINESKFETIMFK